jgi:TRAP-type uncharacterized transport system substrate-binding protein
MVCLLLYKCIMADNSLTMNAMEKRISQLEDFGLQDTVTIANIKKKQEAHQLKLDAMHATIGRMDAHQLKLDAMHTTIGHMDATIGGLCRNMDLILNHIDYHIVPAVNDAFDKLETQVMQLQRLPPGENFPPSRNPVHSNGNHDNPITPLHIIEGYNPVNRSSIPVYRQR